MLSAIIITKNESAKIRDCLESVKWADEIIVLDSGSTDNTVDICKQYTPHVFVTDWPGFGRQKSRALAKATQQWVLSIDADERIPEILRQEIASTLKNPKYDGYFMPRQSYYCGKAIHHSGWRPDYCLRLIKNKCGSFSDDVVHEKIILKGKAGKLKNSIIHYSYDNLQSVIDKMNLYSEISAQQLYAKGKKSNLLKAIIKSIYSLFKTYILRAGFLDGTMGLLLAISNAQGTYYKYAKLALLCKHKNNLPAAK